MRIKHLLVAASLFSFGSSVLAEPPFSALVKDSSQVAKQAGLQSKYAKLFSEKLKQAEGFPVKYILVEGVDLAARRPSSDPQSGIWLFSRTGAMFAPFSSLPRVRIKRDDKYPDDYNVSFGLALPSGTESKRLSCVNFEQFAWWIADRANSLTVTSGACPPLKETEEISEAIVDALQSTNMMTHENQDKHPGIWVAQWTYHNNSGVDIR